MLEDFLESKKKSNETKPNPNTERQINQIRRIVSAVFAHPAFIRSGRDAEMISGIGTFYGNLIQKFIDENEHLKFREHPGTASHTPPDRPCAPVPPPAKKARTTKKAQTTEAVADGDVSLPSKPKKPRAKKQPAETKGAAASTASTDSSSCLPGQGSGSQPTKTRKARAEKWSNPGTCHCAILIALLQGEKEGIAEMGKADIIDKARPYAPTADWNPNPSQGQFYGGWSSMSTITRKFLVTKRSSPALFRLSEEGRRHAEFYHDRHIKLQECTAGGTKSAFFSQNNDDKGMTSDHDSRDFSSTDVSDSERVPEADHPSSPVPMGEGDHPSSPVATASPGTRDRAQTLVGLGYSSGLAMQAARCRGDLDSALDWLANFEDDAAATAPSYTDPTPFHPSSSSSSVSHPPSSTASAYPIDPPSLSASSHPTPTAAATRTAHALASSTPSTQPLTSATSHSEGIAQSATLPPVRPGEPATSWHPPPSYAALGACAATASAVPAYASTPVRSTGIPAPLFASGVVSSPLEIVRKRKMDGSTQPGASACPSTSGDPHDKDWKVVLVVDGRERKALPYFQKHFADSSIVCQLEVGDYLWVARRRSPSSPNGFDEVMLDFIVERKRLDDFQSSIMERRYTDQKVRMRSCGVSKLLYLVEGDLQRYAAGLDGEEGAARLRKAIVTTQITDGFGIHHFNNGQAAITFLENFTRRLQLHVTRMGVAAYALRPSAEHKLSGGADNLVRFQDFLKACKTNKDEQTCSMSSLFAQQICKLKGVSLSKAKCILERYPTQAALIRALRACATNAEREGLLLFLKDGSGRSLGPSVCKTIVDFYSLPTYPPPSAGLGRSNSMSSDDVGTPVTPLTDDSL